MDDALGALDRLLDPGAGGQVAGDDVDAEPGEGVGAPVTLLLSVLALPFLGARFGTFDDRVLPPSAPAAQATQELRRDFDVRGSVAATTVVLPELRLKPPGSPADSPPGGSAAARLADYARRLSAVDGVLRVDTATGGYDHGHPTTADPAAPASAATPTPPRRHCSPAPPAPG
ncbi:hypothetical protein ACQEVS_27750 [Streptomyces sp. CA-181903]|uniref:hypothetical protein n=1 Tax=Streptomyces sp. CA-181903 TaxID=3240055 RepID=UPI003D930157